MTSEPASGWVSSDDDDRELLDYECVDGNWTVKPHEPGRVRSRVQVSFAWYDLWVGVFVDRTKRTVYVCPLPCLLITIKRKPLPPPPVRHHRFLPHLFVEGVCTCGWPPEDERHDLTAPARTLTLEEENVDKQVRQSIRKVWS